jgi:hypothetical protein
MSIIRDLIHVWQCEDCGCKSHIEQKSCPNGCNAKRHTPHPFDDRKVPENESDSEKLSRLEYENRELRKRWWLNHGCDFAALYGDDGEMQCSSCMIDFKRDTVKSILAKHEEKMLEWCEKNREEIEMRMKIIDRKQMGD